MGGIRLTNRQSISKSRDKKLAAAAAIIIVLQIIAAIFVGFQKQEYHIDEIYSYNFSNSAEAEKFSRADWLIGKWVDGADFDEIVTVQEGKEAVKFVTARLSTLSIDSTCMVLFVSVFALNDKIAKIIIQFIVFILNYIFSKYMVFKNAKT